jgi:hypothetical protein
MALVVLAACMLEVVERGYGAIAGRGVGRAARKARSSGANLTLASAPSCRSRTVIW